MTRNALVIGDGLVVDQAALGRIRNRNNHAARTFSIWRALDIMGRGGFGEIGNWFYRHRRFRQQSKQLRQLGLHLVYVFLVVIQNLLLACRPPFWIVVHRFAKAGQILVALVLGQLRHLSRDALNFLQPDLMDVSGWSVDRGHRFYRFDIASFSVSETLDRELGPSLRS